MEGEREKDRRCNGRRQAGWGKRPRLPRRPATNCRRPRLRAARYSRRSARGGRGRLGPQNSAAQNAQPAAPVFPAWRGAARIRALDPRAFVPRNRRMNNAPVCRPACEPSAESRRNYEIRPATGGIPAAVLTDACAVDGNVSKRNEAEI